MSLLQEKYGVSPAKFGLGFLGALAIGTVVGLLIWGSVLWVESRPPPVTEGLIIERWHEEAREWTTQSTIYVQSGNVNIPVTSTSHHYDDPDWKIKIQAEDGRKRTLELERKVWAKLRVGDWYVVKS